MSQTHSFTPPGAARPAVRLGRLAWSDKGANLGEWSGHKKKAWCARASRYMRGHSCVLGPIYNFVDSLLAEEDVEVVSVFPGEVEELKPKAVIEHLRNALSHPTVRNTEPATTGYTSVKDGSGYIVRMRFTDSPDLNGKGNLREDVDGEPRVFSIELPLSRVTALAQCVGLVLAQPAWDNWDSADLVLPSDSE